MITMPTSAFESLLVIAVVLVTAAVAAAGYFWLQAKRNESDAIKWRRHDRDFCDERAAQSRMNDLMNHMQAARTIRIR